MSTLAERLQAISKGFQAEAPPEVLAVMQRATADLVASGQAERALGEGDAWPPFALPAQDGRVVRSDDLLAKGPLVVSFFRGHW